MSLYGPIQVVAARSPALCVLKPFTSSACRARAYSTGPAVNIFKLGALSEPAHHAAAAQWANEFNDAGTRAIPKTAYDTSMSRSSGPGGQNVNKLSTKATVRCALPSVGTVLSTTDPASLWLPPFVIPPLRDSPYFSASPPALLVSSSLTRSAAQNRLDALQKLHGLVVSTARSQIVAPTSELQRGKVRELMRHEEVRRRAEKARLQERKGARRKGSGAGWE